MSVLEYPEKMNEDLQIWDNAAYDNVESEDSAAMNFSWSKMNHLSFNLSQTLEPDSAKGNQNPSVVKSPVSISALPPVKPLQAANVITNSQTIPMAKLGILDRNIYGNVDQVFLGKENLSCQMNLDLEIQEIEKEISRLSLRLESLRLEKVKRSAKFMDPQKKSTKTFDEQSKVEELSSMTAKLKTPRRGLSMGPAEIMREARRGTSLGPAEIYPATKLKQLGKQDISQPASNRRKSCYWKLQGIDELGVTKERGKTLSLSPQSRSKTVSKVQDQKQAATTIGSKITVKINGLVSSIQPKKLFVKDAEKSNFVKKPVKSSRVVASRYQMSTGATSATKELVKSSLPENEEVCKRSDKKCVSLSGKSQGTEKPVAETRVKKQWEIPTEVAILKGMDHKTPLSVQKMLDVVPRIKILPCNNKTPRDSGPARSIPELIGGKSYFNMDDVDVEKMKDPVCQALDFEEQISEEYKKIWVLRCGHKSPSYSGAINRVSQLVKRNYFFDDDHEMPVFNFEEEEDVENL